MKIKTILTVISAIIFATIANAQVSYGIKTGVSLSKTNYDEYPPQFKKSNFTSFFLSAYADLGLGRNFSLQPGVSLQGKGDKYTLDGEKAVTYSVMSIEIPVNVLYYIPTGTSGSVFVGAGPYVGFNISGKNKIETIADGLGFGRSGDHKMSFTGSNKDQNLVDAGVNFLLGYKLSNGFLINAGYGLGFSDLDPEARDGHLHNRTLRFGVGFQF